LEEIGLQNRKSWQKNLTVEFLQTWPADTNICGYLTNSSRIIIPAAALLPFFAQK
jgi:hypothetical protein